MVWYGKECADGILYSFICFSSGTGGTVVNLSILEKFQNSFSPDFIGI